MAAAQHVGAMDTDNDDFLEAIFMNENRCQDEGFLEGQAEGQRKGLEEGFRLGCEKGREIGSELGFYLGYTDIIRKTAAGLNMKNKERVLKTADNLTQLVEAFPITDPRNPNLEEQVQAIRAKFKQLTSLISVRTEFKTAGQAQGVSF